MTTLKLIFLILFPAVSMGQLQRFEVIGSVSGEHKKQIYLFYDDDFGNKDSLRAQIINGKFRFDEKVNLPILCRFHFGEKTNIQELYIDSKKTYVSFSSVLTEQNTPDSLGGARETFRLVNITGSQMQDTIISVEKWSSQLEKSNQSKGKKSSQYYAELLSLIRSDTRNKAGAYLLGKSQLLDYSQVDALSKILDTSLRSTFEWKLVARLLKSLDKAPNRAAGLAFKNVFLKDINNIKVNTILYEKNFVLVDFWASWCKPCREINPELKALYAKYKDHGFEILGVSLDENRLAWKKAIVQDGLPWVQFWDEKSFEGELPTHYDIRGVPQKVLVDNHGKVIGFNLSIKEVDDILTARLKR